MDIFCKIINGEIPSKTVFEDEIIKVIMDVNPRSNGHLLVLPKTHYKDLWDIDTETLNHIMHKAKDLSSMLIEKLNCDGITLEQNNGISQEVKHFHLHIIPKYNKSEKMGLDEIYERIKKDTL